MPKLEGGCECGAIRYEVTGPHNKIVACHCIDCQRQSGSAFGMTLVVAETDFRLTKGAVKTNARRSEAGRRKLGAFCPGCGCRIYNQAEWREGAISIKPGTLDDTSWLIPEIHLWTQNKQSWVILPDGVESFETQPS